MNSRDKSILTGLYLSKYSSKAVQELGFSSYQEAYNVLGFSLGIKPSSIKNYRDEFDPLYTNNRKGWHKRPIREYCKKIFDEFHEIDFKTFSDLIKAFFIENYEMEKFTKITEKKDYSETIAKRLLTGKAAEEYFKIEYNKIDQFKFFDLQDTTQMACGFDFKLSLNNNFYCVEVKGLNTLKGNIQLTEKEYFVAQTFKSKYCLFIVKNFKKKPVHDIIFNPLESQLKFTEIKKEVIQINYTSVI